MADRVVRVSLIAQVAEYNRSMVQAAQATRSVGTEAEKLAQKREAFNTLGKGLAVAGAAMVATAALATRAAAQWESAWAGVTKTVDGTPKQMAQVEKGLRDLTKVLPASHTQIAAVAEAAGQLGIATPNVVAFTKTMIDLGETTNLSAEEAATQLARFVNIMGTSQDKVSNLGSALVGLGNNFATTESEILAMAMRLSKSGVQIGLTEGEVLGLAASLSSVGIEAEAGGSAMSKVMIDIAASVESGGKKLDMFASAAGMSAQDFAEKWKTAPGEALQAFVSGLANAESQGKSTLGLLAELGITEVRMRDALLGSAAASDMFASAMQMGNEEFSKNNALLNEAEKRYATVESKMAMAGNAVNDMAISFGEVLLPALGAAADGLAGVADFLGDLPAPAKVMITVLGGAAGVIALVGGSALLAVPKIAEFKVAMGTLGVTMKGLSLAGGAVGVALTALVAIVGSVSAAHAAARQRAESYAEALKAGTSAVDELIVSNLQAEQSFLWINRGSAYDAAEKLGVGLDTLTDAAKGNKDALAELSVYTRAYRGDQEAFNQLMSETGLGAYELGAALDVMVGALNDQGVAQEDATRLNEQAADAQGENASAAEQMSEAQRKAAEEAKALAEAADQAAGDLDEMKAALDGVAGSAMSMGDAKDKARGSINSLAEAAKDEKASLKGANDESIRFRKAVRDVEDAHRDSAAAIIENGGTLKDARAEWRRGREAVLDQLEAMGLSRREARRWADENLGSSADVRDALGLVKAAFDKASAAAEGMPNEVKTRVTASGVQAVIDSLGRLRRIINDVNGADVEVRVGGGGRVARAAGGAITGPGTATSDSIPALLSNGEHVLTARDVQAMGGQSGVYAFRHNLHNGDRRFASGGAVTLSRAEDEVRRAEAKYRAAKSKAAREKAKGELDDARAELEDVRRAFRSDQSDWRRAQRRGENRAAGMGGNGLSLVDQLFDLADQIGGPAGKRLRQRAMDSEKQYLRLERQASKAAVALDDARDKLADLRSAATSMALAVANAVRGFFNLGKLGESTTAEKTRAKRETVTIDGQTYSFDGVETYTETTGPTAGSILAGTRAAESRIRGFAEKLKSLATKGLNPKLLEEIAMLGVENGEPIADALLAASAQEISDLNSSYAGIDKYSAEAGGTVKDANFKALIDQAVKDRDEAKKNAQDIQKKLETETTRVIKSITDALAKGVKKAAGGPVVGAGTATSDSIPAWLSNGENVWSAAHVDAWGGQGAVERLKRMGPARYAMGGPVLVPTAQAFSAQSLSLDGMHITGTFEIGGDGLGRIIDGRVETQQQRAYSRLRAEVAEW